MNKNDATTYYSRVYPDGIRIRTAASGEKTAQFIGEEAVISLPNCESDEYGIATILYSVAMKQLQLAAPLPGDAILVIAEGGAEGLIALLAAKEFSLQTYYLDSTPDSLKAASELGATVYASAPEMASSIREATSSEGPNIIIDLSAYEGIVSLVVDNILSQAGRMVVGTRNKPVDSYQMRMGSYKEINLFGCDRCTKVADLSPDTELLLKNLTGVIAF